MSQKKEKQGQSPKPKIYGIDNPKWAVLQYNRYIESLIVELRFFLETHQKHAQKLPKIYRKTDPKKELKLQFYPISDDYTDTPDQLIKQILDEIPDHAIRTMFPELREKIVRLSIAQENLHHFQKAVTDSYSPEGLTHLVARTPVESKAIRNVIVVKSRYRPQFVYANESNNAATPVANGWVLFWKYRTNRLNGKVDRTIIDYTSQSGFFAETIGLARTDSEGRMIYSDPFANGKGQSFGKAQFCPKTDSFRIVTDPKIRAMAKERLKKNPADPFEGEQLTELIASYPDPYIDAVEKEQKGSEQEWLDIEPWSTAYLATGTYGFMPLPANLGDCEIKDLKSLPDQTLKLNGKELPVAIVQKIDGNTPETPIELPCNLREWTRRINRKRKELQKAQIKLSEIVQTHDDSGRLVRQIKQFVEIQSSFGFWYDSMEMKNSPGNAEKLNFEFEKLLEMERINKGSAGLLKQDRWNRARNSYKPFQKRNELINAYNTLDNHIKDYIDNGENYFLKNVDQSEVNEKSSTWELAVNALYELFSKEDDELRKTITTRDRNYAEQKAKVKQHAEELYTLIRSESFQTHFRLYMERQQKVQLPADLEKKQEKHLNYLKNYYDQLFDSENPEEIQPPKNPDFPQVVLFPIPFDFMKADYYSGFLFEILSHSLLMMDGFLDKKVWEEEVKPGLTKLVKRKELEKMDQEIKDGFSAVEADYLGKRNKMGDQITNKIQSISKTLPRTIDDEQSELSNSILEIWAFTWNGFVTYKDLLSSVVIAAPGPDCLLQAALKIFEQHAVADIVKNPGKKGFYIHIMTAVLAVCRFQLFGSSIDKLNRAIAFGFSTNVNLSRSKDQLRLFLHNAAYGEGGVPPRAQILSISALKTGFLVLNLYSLRDEWEKLESITTENELTHIARSVLQYLHFGMKSMSAICSASLLLGNTLPLLGQNTTAGLLGSALGGKLVEQVVAKVADRLAFGLSAIAAAESTGKFLHLYIREGNSQRVNIAGLEAAGNIMLTSGLIFSAETILGLSNCLYFPGVGPWLFVGGIAFLLIAGNYETIYDFLRFDTEEEYKNMWTQFEQSVNYPIYSDRRYGAKDAIIQSIQQIKELVGKTWIFGKLTWHAIVPLHNMGFDRERIEAMVNLSPGNNDARDTLANLLATANPEAVTSYRGKPYGSFRIEPNLVEKIINLYEMVKNPEARKKELGTKNYQQITMELEQGCYQPLSYDELYDNLKDDQPDSLFPTAYNFLEHPFYSVLPESWGVDVFCQRVCQIHDQNRERLRSGKIDDLQGYALKK